MTATVQSIIDFLETRASTTPLTSDQVNALVSDLRSQINQLSVTVPGAQPGAITLLYSGQFGEGVHSGAVAAAIADTHPGQILTINQTEVYELLSSERFQKALLSALGPESEARDQIYDALINGSKDANGVRVADRDENSSPTAPLPCRGGAWPV